ncbi:hypothetical protein [Metabacillus sp. Hm71]
MEQCIYCQSVYSLEESDSLNKPVFCSLECQKKFYKGLDEPLEFID